ncbi:MAG: hypothetical protein K2Q15_17550 [Burkholderiales bacterium]|nr:hypothetical protein [Burkholderiales bacterium]
MSLKISLSALLFLAFGSTSLCHAATQQLEIRSAIHTSARTQTPIALSQAPSNFKVGFIRDAPAPFYLNRDRHFLEGVSADYLQVIGEISGLNFIAISLDSEEDALKALKAGDIDLLADLDYIQDKDLLSSQPYFTNRQVEVRRANNLNDSKQTQSRLKRLR